MKGQYHLSDFEFTKQFKSETLSPKFFNHEAHLRLAWIYINCDGIDKAIKKNCKEIMFYASSLGATDKYNKTVTIAAVRVVYHFYLKSKSDNFKDFLEEFPRLNNNFNDLLEQHYSIDIFNLKIAKSLFLEPNLLPFDN